MPIFTCFSIKDNNIEVHSFSKQRLRNIDVKISRYQIGINSEKEYIHANVK